MLLRLTSFALRHHFVTKPEGEKMPKQNGYTIRKRGNGWQANLSRRRPPQTVILSSTGASAIRFA
jgi:hypothetical protein